MITTFREKNPGRVMRAALLSCKTDALGRKVAVIKRNGKIVPVRLVKRRHSVVPSDFEAFVSGYASVFNISGNGIVVDVESGRHIETGAGRYGTTGRDIGLKRKKRTLHGEKQERRSKYRFMLSKGVANG